MIMDELRRELKPTISASRLNYFYQEIFGEKINCLTCGSSVKTAYEKLQTKLFNPMAKNRVKQEYFNQTINLYELGINGFNGYSDQVVIDKVAATPKYAHLVEEAPEEAKAQVKAKPKAKEKKK